MAQTNLTLSDVFTPATQQTWLTTLLGASTSLGLPATSWQSGAIARTMLSVVSWALAGEDSLISVASQGGFLDFAASGTATFTNPTTGVVTTVAVTPDPSTLTPTQLASWQPGWLDILADGRYNCQRIPATYATGTVALTNSTGSSYGPYAPGTFHIANATNGATYSNTATFTIAPQSIAGGVIIGATATSPVSIATINTHGLSTGAVVTIAGCLGVTGVNGTWSVVVTSISTFQLVGSSGGGALITPTYGTVNVCTNAVFQADVIGSSSLSGPNTITTPVTALLGISCTNLGSLTGASYESNNALAARCRLKLQSLSPNGPAGAYVYFAKTSSTLLPTGVALSQPVTRAIAPAANGQVNVYVANAGGAISGATNLAITNITLAGGVMTITMPVVTGLGVGMTILISGVTGLVGANGTWIVATLTGSGITVAASAVSGTYASGGVIEAGDLGLIDSVIQANCVPAGTTATTVSATTVTVTVAGTIYVPSAQAAAYAPALGTALTAYFANLNIGGVTTDGATNVVPIGAVEGVCYQAGLNTTTSANVVSGITGFTLNGSASDVTIGTTQVATFVNNLTVVGQ